MQANSVTPSNTVATLPDSFASPTTPGVGAEQTPFANLFRNAIDNVQQLEDKASTAVQGLLDGSGVDVHTAMIATSNADAAFELSLAIRNKAVAAFQQLMGMQF